MKKIAALLLALVMVFALAACGAPADQPAETPSQDVTEPTPTPSGEVPEPTPSAEPSDEPTGEPSPAPAEDGVRLAVMSGPTGVGAAKLLNDADKGETVNEYHYTIANDNSEVMAGLISAEPTFDIATVASNVAVNLYNKTDGGVKIIALGTQGVLHILEGSGGTTIQTVTDLAGQTIYSPGQGANPEYILRYLLQTSGLDPDRDVTIVFADASEIQAKLLSGEIKYAMLPVPAATATLIKGEGQVRAAIDVTEAWNQSNSGSQLIMTAVVARTQFIEENPEAVQAFLQEYKASIDYVNGNPAQAAEWIAGYGITPNAAIAEKAIPQCHLIYIDGAAMPLAISDYFMELYSVDPSAVGGVLPDDGIYYVP